MSAPVAAVIGEALIDLIPDGGEQHFRAGLGGSPYNVAIGLARLDIDTALFARLSNTGFGRLLRRHAVQESLSVLPSLPAHEQTTLAVVTLDENSVASYDFYLENTADWQWTDDEIANLPTPSKVLHFGSLAAWTAPGDAQIRALVKRLHDAGEVLISYDPNVRPSLLGKPESARPTIESNVVLANVVKASTEDLDWLYPGDAYDEIAARWLALGPSLVVITAGADGGYAYHHSGTRLTVPGIAVKVADTVGAGDSFSSALLASAISHELATPAAVLDADERLLTAIVSEATKASAITCTRVGADPPTLADLQSAATGG